MKKQYFFFLLAPIFFIIITFSSFGWHNKGLSITEQNVPLFKSVGALTDVPWEYLAAIHQYEENINRTQKSKKKDTERPLISIRIPAHIWAGPTNPLPNDTNPQSISFFGGIGTDATRDKIANPKDPADVLHSLSLYLTLHGKDEDHIRSQIWHYYHNTVTVDIISHIAKIFKKYQTVQLHQTLFPIPLKYIYSYKSTWGAPRGFGGARIHEGSDIYAHYGTPILSTCYGYVELMGWNRYGGWRIGIRDTHNTYHYFAHLNHFRKGLKQGDIVKPGEVIGSVGASGYGPPGTSGKFPPHLHFGLYSFNGRSSFAFDPYPRLKKWERAAKKAK